MTIELCLVSAAGAQCQRVQVAQDSRVEQVLAHAQQTGLLAHQPADRGERLGTAAWVVARDGQRVPPDLVLHDGERLELLPPLLVDPKVARRRRAGRA